MLARSIQDVHELNTLANALPMQLRTVELIVPVDEIGRRLASDPTVGRRADLANATEWLSAGLGSGLAEFVVSNDAPIEHVTATILEWLRWPMSKRQEP